MNTEFRQGCLGQPAPIIRQSFSQFIQRSRDLYLPSDLSSFLPSHHFLTCSVYPKLVSHLLHISYWLPPWTPLTCVTFYCSFTSAGACVLVNGSSLLLPFLPLPLCLIGVMAGSYWKWRFSVLGPVSSLIWVRINNSEKTRCCSNSLRYSQLSICSLGKGGSMPTASRTFIC